MKIQVYHDTFDTLCRTPFGALPCGASVTLRLFVGAGVNASVALRAWDGEERLISPCNIAPADGFLLSDPAAAQRLRDFFGGTVFTFVLQAGAAPSLMWYSFRVESEGRRYYVGAQDEELRCGCVCGAGLPKDYRITVYDGGFKTPDWFKNAIAYQIFPDRFFRGCADEPGADVLRRRAPRRRAYFKAWDELPDWQPRDGARFYSPCDYYLGDLKGIIEKIPYLKSLGVGVVYLNPVFESPYNHRYSISDYMRIDPLLGTEEDFVRMCEALRQNGIKLILDGVFSHTGDDSIYFDRYGNYGGTGAYGRPDSPYRGWYFFDGRYKCGYRSWWGFDTLPEVNELEPTYMAFVAEVLKKWLRLGASGWRLDVADELPDGFLRFLRAEVKSIDPQAVVIGEVWEDAAAKKGVCDVSGTIGRRGYTDGDKLDGVMDYPFADAVCDFLSGAADAFALKNALLAQLAGYPDEFMRAQLGMLGSHDTHRVLSRLSGAPPKDTLPREKQAVWSPTPELAQTGKKRLMQAAALQFSMPFAPCIYYGDEAGLTGLSDPFCRKPYPWGGEDQALLTFYKKLTALRADSAALSGGQTAFAAPNGEAFAVYRRSGRSAVVIAVSRTAQKFTLGEADFLGGANVRITEGAKLLLSSPAGEGACVSSREGCITFVLPSGGMAAIGFTLERE